MLCRAATHLPPDVFVVHVSNEQTLGGESVRLHINIGSGDFVDEAGFAGVREAGEDESAGARVDGRQTSQVLSDLLQIGERLSLLLHQGAHSGQAKRKRTNNCMACSAMVLGCLVIDFGTVSQA